MYWTIAALAVTVSPLWIFLAGPTARLPADREWRVYGGDRGSTRYSPLTQINRSNVANLKVAWAFHTGDLKPNVITTIECSPIVVDGVMYVTSPTIKAFAINAAT